MNNLFETGDYKALQLSHYLQGKQLVVSDTILLLGILRIFKTINITSADAKYTTTRKCEIVCFATYCMDFCIFFPLFNVDELEICGL